MFCYIISYDIGDPGEYDGLYKAIKSYGTWAKITESTWAVVSDKTATEVRDHLSGYTNLGDRIFVIRSGTVAAWRNVICKNEWLKKNL